MSKTLAAYSANALSFDLDCDGLADSLEQQLAPFRPYYKFSLDSGEDGDHPTDALWFVRNNEWLDPGYLRPLSGSPDLRTDLSPIHSDPR